MKIVIAFVLIFAGLVIWLRVLKPEQRLEVRKNLRPLLVPGLVASMSICALVVLAVFNGGIAFL